MCAYVVRESVTAAVTCVRRSTSGSSGGPVATAAAAARAVPVQQPICWPADGIACTAGPRAVAAACRALVTAGGARKLGWRGGAAVRSQVTSQKFSLGSTALRERPPPRRRRRRRSPARYVRRPKTADEDFRRSFFRFCSVAVLFFFSYEFFRLFNTPQYYNSR